MGLKERYEEAKKNLIEDKSINLSNRKLFTEFFDWEERKLKRVNNNATVDESSYRTLYGYIHRIRNVNKWFKNKSWKTLTEDDIRKVYDNLEDGKIKNANGQPFKDRESYYNKIMKSKLFSMVGKADIAKTVIEFYTPNKNDNVRFFKESDFKDFIDLVVRPIGKCLFWLGWDLGENLSTILELKVRDCVRDINNNTNEIEYRINFRKEILKRARTARSEITLHKETARLLDLRLKEMHTEHLEWFTNLTDENKRKLPKGISAELPPNKKLFNFGPRQAAKMFSNAANKCNLIVQPSGERATIKDLRSSMSCHLLKEGWSTDLVNRRLGHRPSSREIDKYVNFLAVDTKKPKKILFDNQVENLRREVENLKQREKLLNIKLEDSQTESQRNTEKIKSQELSIQDMEMGVIEIHKQMKSFMRLLSKREKDMKVFLSPFN